MFSQQITTDFRVWRTDGFDNVQSFSARHELIDEWEELRLSVQPQLLFWFFFVRKVEKNSVDMKLSYLCVFMDCGWELRSVIKLVTLELSIRWLAWMGEMWTLKQELGNLFKFMKTGNFRPLSQFCCFSCAYVGGYVCVCLKNPEWGVCSCLSDLVWFHHIKLLFWIYPWAFYISLPRAVLNVFSSWLAGCDAKRHAKDDLHIWKLGWASSRVKGAYEQGTGKFYFIWCSSCKCKPNLFSCPFP